MRCRRLDEEEAPLGRDTEGLVPVGLGHVLDRLRREAVPGRLHEQVEPAELRGRALDEGARVGGAGEIRLGASRCDDRVARRRETAGDRRAELPGPAGYEGAHGR